MIEPQVILRIVTLGMKNGGLMTSHARSAGCASFHNVKAMIKNCHLVKVVISHV